MSNCCKGACWCKFLPHNWLCLKGLYVVFIVLFYITLLFGVYMTWQIASYPLLSGKEMWTVLGGVLAQILGAALFLLTIAKILKALAKIKHAVAPCCCQTEKADEKAAKKAVKKEEK